MRNKITIIILFLLCGFSAWAQTPEKMIARLKTELQGKPDARRTAAIYSDLVWYYSNVSLDSALAYGARAKSEARKLNDSTLLAQVYSDIGAAYFNKSDYENSKTSYLAALKIRKIRKDAKGMAKLNNNLANIYLNQKKYELSMANFLEALRYFEANGDPENANVAKSNIGLLWSNLRNYPKAVEYLKAAIRYSETNQLNGRLCESYINLGNVYRYMHDSINAMRYYNKSLKSCQLAANTKAIASVYQNIAVMKSSEGGKKNGEAYQKFEQLRKNFDASTNNNAKFSGVRQDMVALNFEKARDTLLVMKKKFEKAKSNPELLIAYQYFVPIYAYMNLPDSVVYYAARYNEMHDKLLAIQNSAQTAELEEKYQAEKKERLLLLRETQLRQKNNMLIGLTLFALFVALIGLLIYRQQKLRNRQQEQEFELKTAISQIETQNRLQEQRLSISRDLHDNIGAQLTFIISSVDNIKHAFDLQNVKLNDKLRSISEFTKSTIVELRDTIWAMNNNAITFEDLKVRILNFIEKAKMAREDIHFTFDIDKDMEGIELSSIAGMNIYRTLQEAVNNAIKHADAGNITIAAKPAGDTIHITITDDGKGFDIIADAGGNGLHNMKKRIEDIGGNLHIESSKGRGTSVIFEVLCPKNGC